MTDEKNEKRKAKAEYMREYWKKNPEKYRKWLDRMNEARIARRQSDPEYRQKQIERLRKERRDRYGSDPEYTERTIQHSRNAYAKLRQQILSAYGGRCMCCGESEPIFLEIDHVHGGGSKHYREENAGTAYRRIIREGFPDRFQLLCCNCNRGRARCGGICPHKKGESAK